MLTVNLIDISKDDIDIVGGKGANLGELIQSGFPVPPGFCVTSQAYDLFIEKNRFEGGIESGLKNISDDPEALTRLSQQRRETIVNGKLPKELTEAIKNQHQMLGQSVRMAVRSSATAEDLPQASFAGQQETYLNVIGFEQLIGAVSKSIHLVNDIERKSEKKQVPINGCCGKETVDHVFFKRHFFMVSFQ